MWGSRKRRERRDREPERGRDHGAGRASANGRSSSWARRPVAEWPRPAGPARYFGARVLFQESGGRWDGDPRPCGVVQTWQGPARVALMWPLPGMAVRRPSSADVHAVEPEAEVVVRVGGGWGISGPDLWRADEPRDGDHVPWADLSAALGMPLPYWPYFLRAPELITAWRPGAPPVKAPVVPDLDTGPLLEMAALFDCEHPTHRTLLNLVRRSQAVAASSALEDINRIGGEFGPDPQTVLVAAEPIAVPDAERDDLDEATRRAGWLEVLSRSDVLAGACVEQVRIQDGGADFPASHPTRLKHVSSRWEREWTARLAPAAQTAAHSQLNLDDEDLDDDLDEDLDEDLDDAEAREGGEVGAATMVDPATDAPVVRHRDGSYSVALPQRLPATSPLAEVVLDRPLIWVRTQDGTLYPAPVDSYFGIEWGYAGSGPGSLALLIHRLLADINARAADDITGAPDGLEELCAQDWDEGTVLTRAQLEDADR